MHKETGTYQLWEIESNEELDMLIKIGEQPSKIAPSDALYSQNCLFANKDAQDMYHPIGSVTKDGKVYYESTARPKWAMFVIPKVGKPYITHTPPPIADRKLSFYGTPQILKTGKVDITSTKEGTASDIANSSAYRSTIGIKADGQIGLVRTKTTHTLRELANLMLSLGFVDAMNMDGGGSAVTHKKGDPYIWQRPTSSSLFVKRVVSIAPNPTSKPILIIDPGHGGKDPGGGSSIFWDSNGFYEKDMVLQMSLYQHDRFKELGVPVALTRDKDIYLSPEDRTNIIKASGAKYCLSNHINAASDPKARGVETIHSVKASSKIATTLLNAIVAVGMAMRRVFSKAQSDGQDWYFMHRLTGSVITTINEYGFATNEIDARLILQNWKVYAESQVKAWCEILGYKYTPKKIESVKVEPTPKKPLLRLIVHGKQIGAYATEEFLLANVKVAIDSGAKEIIIEEVK